MIVCAGLLVGLALAPGIAPTASTPTTVQVVLGQLTVQAGDGQTNMLKVVDKDGVLHVSDKVPMMAGPGCQQATGTSVTCPSRDVSSLFFLLGDGDDKAEFPKVTFPVSGDGGPGIDFLTGGSAGDSLSGGTGDDTIDGSVGADTLVGGVGADLLLGGAQDDVLYGDSTVSEPACLTDQLSCVDRLEGQEENDYLAGGEQGDFLFGAGGLDTLDEPTSGKNQLAGGQGDDSITGAGLSGDMRDMVMYNDYVRDVWVNLSDKPYEGLAAGHAWELRSIGVVLELDTITGVLDITTGAGNDVLIGRSDNPTLNPGAGSNLCDRNGNDGVELTPCP